MIGSIFAVFPGPVFDPPLRETSGGWVRAHFPEQRLVIDPKAMMHLCFCAAHFKGRMHAVHLSHNALQSPFFRGKISLWSLGTRRLVPTKQRARV